MLSYFTFRWHRQVRRWRKSLWVGRRWLSNYLDRHVYGAWQKLGALRWMFVSWLAIVGISIWGITAGIASLDNYFVTTQPVSGGIYTEGILGEVRVVNPILPENTATSDVSSLVFNGLTRVNTERIIEPDLAERWEVSADQKSYTFYLRKDVLWQDGQAFSAKDVAFTVAAIQNPDSRSPLSANWQGIKFEVINDYTIRFNLPNSYTSFLSTTTVGILPHHLLDSIRLSTLRINPFSQNPIGTGPYRLENLSKDSGVIVLKANERYFRGRPLMDEVHFALYDSPASLLDGYARKQVLGISQLNPDQLAVAKKNDNLTIRSFSLPAYVGLFFNTKTPYLTEASTRQAIARAIDRNRIIDGTLSGSAVPVYYPILPGQAGFNAKAARYSYDLARATTDLKNKKPTKPLRLVTLKTPEYSAVARDIAQQLSLVGIPVEVIESDIISLQQNNIRARNYDLLLYGQNTGVDPDAYAYWHSSQATDPGLNVANYKSAEADRLLEAARLARDANVRAAKYAGFVDVWAKDAPAVLLYSPRYLYGQDNRVEGTRLGKIAEPSDRFYGIEKWSMKRQRILKRDAVPE